MDNDSSKNMTDVKMPNCLSYRTQNSVTVGVSSNKPTDCKVDLARWHKYMQHDNCLCFLIT